MKLEDMISAVQKKVGVAVDGKAGPQTWSAIYSKLVDAKVSPAYLANVIDVVDARSEKVIATLLPEVRPYARALVQNALAGGIKLRIISGLRTYAEQDALYAQGRTAPGNVVTKARAGYSAHNFGIAFDVGLFEGNSYLGESPMYKAVGLLGQNIGLEWGGNWKTIVDQPHFELRPSWAVDLAESQMMAEMRQRVATDRPIFA
ncbi:M15 family metallopeptidase [Rhodanobacter sp. AS-Z3]|uniref:M15 family metallopeptidase n=1 Tax=Rhodanobacter sp. AS-Z3 TaxID=3031330 RepID=UPI002479E847|nr:M15 family metallopeptidase [Rhodanobacter sp. AS-Z3]WEN14030.1 M15 family metallopeptidase [Rhodanobacter sp. AS-Z3]